MKQAGRLERFRQTSLFCNLTREKKGFFIKGGLRARTFPFSDIGGSTRLTQM